MDGRFSESGMARDVFGIPDIYVAVIHTYSTLIEKKNSTLTNTDILEIDSLFSLPRFYQTLTTRASDKINYACTGTLS